jgi:uncharacterized protein (TIGR00251 family)
VTRDAGWYRYDIASRRLVLTLHVQPGARRSSVAGLHGDALKVKIAAPPVDGEANAALVDFLSGVLAVAKSAVAIRRGTAGRRKIVEIIGGPELVARVERLAAARVAPAAASAGKACVRES